MKKSLLIGCSAIIAFSSLGQFTAANEPSIGDSRVLYVIDSLAPNLDAINGSGVEWDYSAYGGYGDIQRNITVQDATTTPNALSFPNATKALAIQDFLIQYFSSDTDERLGYGFVFEEPSIGEIIAAFTVDPALLYTYPMVLNDEINDAFEGTLSASIFGPMTPEAQGNVVAKVDGSGTLKLADGIEFTNVSRYKLIETLIAELDIFGSIQEFEVIRTQYEYYALADGNIPVFVHTSIRIAQVGATEPISEFTLVMSAEDPDLILGIGSENMADFAVYPNPASDFVNVQLVNNDANGTIQVLDLQGRVMKIQSTNNGLNTIDVSGLQSGVYMLQVSANGHIASKRVVVK